MFPKIACHAVTGPSCLEMDLGPPLAFKLWLVAVQLLVLCFTFVVAKLVGKFQDGEAGWMLSCPLQHICLSSWAAVLQGSYKIFEVLLDNFFG